MEAPGLDQNWASPFGLDPRILAVADTAMAYRFLPSAFGAEVDRLYLAGGDHLLAIQSWTSSAAWTPASGRAYLDLGDWSNGTVSTDPVVVNYGDFVGSAMFGPVGDPEYILYVGMSDGKILAFRDSVEPGMIANPGNPGARVTTPMARRVWDATVDGAITGIAVFSPDRLWGRTGNETVAVATSTGQLSLFGVASGAWDMADESRLGDPLNHTLLGRWQHPGSLAVNLAGGPMRGILPQWSPAFSEDGHRLAASTSDGVLLMFEASPAGLTERWTLTVAPSVSDWDSPPVIADLPAGGEAVWAGSTRGWLIPRTLEGSLLDGWADRVGADGYPDGGVRLIDSQSRPEEGRVRQPGPAGETMLASTSEGRLYAVRLTGTGAYGPGSQRWSYSDPGLECADPEFLGAPQTDIASGSVVVAGRLRSPRGGIEGTVLMVRLTYGSNFRALFSGERPFSRPAIGKDVDHIFPSVWVASSGATTTVRALSLGSVNPENWRSLCAAELAFPFLVGIVVIGIVVAVVGVVFWTRVFRRRPPKEEITPVERRAQL